MLFLAFSRSLARCVQACYVLTVEIGMPIDVVTLQSSVPVMLLDVTSNNAMVSRTAADEKVWVAVHERL